MVCVWGNHTIEVQLVDVCARNAHTSFVEKEIFFFGE